VSVIILPLDPENTAILEPVEPPGSETRLVESIPVS